MSGDPISMRAVDNTVVITLRDSHLAAAYVALLASSGDSELRADAGLLTVFASRAWPDEDLWDDEEWR